MLRSPRLRPTPTPSAVRRRLVIETTLIEATHSPTLHTPREAFCRRWLGLDRLTPTSPCPGSMTNTILTVRGAAR